jgi:hypothetical protein
LNEFTRNMIAQRRAEPTDDLISVLTHAEIDGEKLTDEDIVIETLLILLGDETTRHVLTGGTEQCCAIANPTTGCAAIRTRSCPPPSRRCCAGPHR